MILRWLAAGTVLIVVAFFIPGTNIDLWVNLNAAGIAAAVYLLALLFYTIRDPISMKTRIVAWVVSVVILGATTTSWTTMDALSHWQKETLLRIRQVIGRGIILAEVPLQKLLPALEAYHGQGAKKKETLGQVFQRLNPEAAAGANIHRKMNDSDSLSVFVQTMNDSAIVLIGQEAFVKGRSPNFQNYNGRVGMVQEKFVLTERGLRRESEN